MILGRVRGQVVATIKHQAYAGRRLLLLDRIDAHGLWPWTGRGSTVPLYKSCA